MSKKPLKILQASAGSGKTFSLAAYYLTLLFSSETKYREILAVTFTNKATEEMKTRILEVLEGIAKGDPSDKIDAYRVLILQAHPQLSPSELQVKADKVYRKILHDYSRFSVFTIDGFVQRVIRGFAFELGLSADYGVEMNQDKVKMELVEMLNGTLANNKKLLQWIIDLALDRIESDKGWNYKKDLLELLKQVFVEKFQLFEAALDKVEGKDIDVVFADLIKVTKQEIKQFEEGMSSKLEAVKTVIDAHGLTKEQLAEKSRNPLLALTAMVKGDFAKLPKLFTLIDEPSKWFAKKTSLEPIYDEVNPLLKDVQAFYALHRGKYYLASAFHKNLYYLRIMQEVAALLKVYRAENGNLMISDAQKLVSGITDDAGDNPSFIWEKVGNKYRHFLFDEFQDTSRSQWGSFKSLLSNAIADADQLEDSHLIVGDTKQSIYRWRDGDYNILHTQAKMDIGPHNVKEESLEENYRSTENIILFNNFLYHSLPKILQSELNARVDDALMDWWQQQQFHQVIESIYSGSTQKLAKSTKPGGTIFVKKFGKEEIEAVENLEKQDFKEASIAEVIAEIKKLQRDHEYVLSDMAVLVRGNSEARLVVNRLLEAGLPVLSGEALLISNDSTIKLLINTMRCMVSLDSQASIYKANCVALYKRICGGEALPEDYFGLNEKALSNLGHLLPPVLCREWQNWLQLPLPELTELLIEVYGLNTQTHHLPYLLAFRDLTASAGRYGEKGLLAFLKWWEEEGEKKTLPSPDGVNAIQVMTIHKSKGLAFRAVFVPFCDWDLNSNAKNQFWVSVKDTDYGILEEVPLNFSSDLAHSSLGGLYFEETLGNFVDALNVLYVATTRCKDYLYLGTKGKGKDNLVTIGDLINVGIYAQAEGSNIYLIEDYVPSKNTPRYTNQIPLDFYPTTGRLSELYVSPENKHLKHLVNIEKSGRKGSILHEILAFANSEAEVDQHLADLISQGIVQERECGDLKNAAMKVLTNPELQALLGSAVQHITEKSIIDADGKLHRPDRILITGDSVVILDYKFTLEEQDAHIEQVYTYKELLSSMGYENVKTYLYYAIKEKLKQV